MTKARNSHFLFVIKLIFLQVNIKIIAVPKSGNDKIFNR